MKAKSQPRTLASVSKDIFSFLQLHLFNRVRLKYPTFEEYASRKHRKGYDHAELKKLCHVDRLIVKNLALYKPFSYYKMTEIWPMLEPQIIHHSKLTKVFKSGKKFELLSWYELSEPFLKSLYADPPTYATLTPRAKRAFDRLTSKSFIDTIGLEQTQTDTEHMDTTDRLLEDNAASARRAVEIARARRERKSATHKRASIDRQLTAKKPRIPEPSAADDIPPDDDKNTFTLDSKPKSMSNIRLAASTPTRTFDASQAYVARLRALVEKKSIGAATASRYAKTVGIKGVTFREPRSGASIEDYDVKEQLAVLKESIAYIKQHSIKVQPEDKRWLQLQLNALAHQLKGS